MSQPESRKILSVSEGIEEKDGQEYVSFSTKIEDSFKLSPEVLGTILISIADTCAWGVPEKDLALFERQVMDFLNHNYLSRFKSVNVKYLPNE